MYTLTIRRYGRYLSFETLEELIEELSRYFTPRELKCGIIDRLTDFTHTPFKDGYCKNNYQDFQVCWYPPDEE